VFDNWVELGISCAVPRSGGYTTPAHLGLAQERYAHGQSLLPGPSRFSSFQQQVGLAFFEGTVILAFSFTTIKEAQKSMRKGVVAVVSFTITPLLSRTISTIAG